MNKENIISNKFEEICFKVLKHFSYSIKSNEKSVINNYIFEPDAIIKDEAHREAVVEIKFYRNFSVNLGLIENALEKLRKDSFIFNIPNKVLIISAKLDAYYKEAFEIDYGVNIIDIENLLFLCGEIPEAKNELVELLGLKSDNENDIKGLPFNFSDVFGFQSETKFENVIPKIEIEKVSKGQSLYKELKNISPGQHTFVEYEKKCTEILKYLFDSALDGWHMQNRTEDGLHRFDLICRIKVNEGIWSIFINDFKSRYLLFEFKNYQDQISQNQIYTTEKYLFAKALRNIAIIISRNGASINALKASDGIIKENGKVILNLCDSGLYEMIKMKESGSDPTDFLFDLLDERLLQLSK